MACAAGPGPAAAPGQATHPMQLSDILSVDRTACGVKIGSKKRALEYAADLIARADPDLVSGEVFDALIARERLGTTGLGRGVAIPHGRSKHGRHTVGAFVRVHSGIDFDAPDHEPVDLIFALLVPQDSTDEHLEVLARLAEMFSDETFRERLRRQDDCAGTFELLTGPRP